MPMNQSTRNVAVIVAVLVLLGAGVWWLQTSKAAPAGHLLVAGNVRPDIRTVSAPAITYPTPDYTVGIPKPAGSAPSAPKRSGTAPARSGQPTVAGMLESVPVREGDRVKAGQLVAQFDTTMLDLGVAQAKTAATKSRKDVSVMSKNIDKLATASSKLSTARAKIATAKSGLLKAKSALLKARKQLLAQRKKLLQAKAQRPQLEAALAALKAQAAMFPPGKVPPALMKQIAQLTGLLAAIDPGLAGIAKGLKTIDTNLAKVNKGLAALPAASAQIASAASKLADAKVQLRNAKDVLGIVAKGQDTAVQLARARRLQAFVRSPIDGVVTFARHPGTVAMVGAPLVRVHANPPQRVDTYLTSEQVATVGVGSEADITFDSAPGTVLHGRISEMGSAYVFPPTSFPTQVVHMTRALKVTIELDPGATAPAGTPVDISLHTN
jgi:multidrug resistance efflux pump